MEQRGFQAGDPRRTRRCPLWTLGNRVLLALAICRPDKDTESGPTGLCESLSARLEQGCRITTGTTGTRTGPGGQPRTREGGRVGGHLGVYLSIAEERRKMIGLSTCRGMGGLIGWTHACACRRVG